MVVVDRQTGKSHGEHFLLDADYLCRKLNEQYPPMPECCWRCQTPLPPETPVEIHLCDACRRMPADSALAELLGHAKALRDAKPPFDLLTQEERREQLQALIGDVDNLPNEALVDLAGRCAESIAMRLHSVPESVRIDEEQDAPLYDSGGYRPSNEERDEIESRIEVTEDNVPPVDEVPVYNLAKFRADADGFEPRPAA